MDFGYYNARIRGFRDRLLKSRDYDALVNSEGLAQYMERLKATGYGQYMEVAAARYKEPEDMLSAAFRASLANTLERFWKIAPDEIKPFLDAVLSVWVVYDLKAILRGIARGLKREEILRIVFPAGELDEGALKELVSSKDVNDFVKLLETWRSSYAKPLKAGLAFYAGQGSIAEMEIRLDHFAFERLFAGMEGGADSIEALKRLVRLRVDITNMLTLIKISGTGMDSDRAADFFIKGGERLGKDFFMNASQSKDRAGLFKKLSQAIKEADLNAILSGDTANLSLIEEQFDNVIERRLRKEAAADPLGVALGAAFIYMKIREIKNLRIIARGKLFNMPPELIKNSLIFPL